MSTPEHRYLRPKDVRKRQLLADKPTRYVGCSVGQKTINVINSGNEYCIHNSWNFFSMYSQLCHSNRSLDILQVVAIYQPTLTICEFYLMLMVRQSFYADSRYKASLRDVSHRMGCYSSVHSNHYLILWKQKAKPIVGLFTFYSNKYYTYPLVSLNNSTVSTQIFRRIHCDLPWHFLIHSKWPALWSTWFQYTLQTAVCSNPTRYQMKIQV